MNTIESTNTAMKKYDCLFINTHLATFPADSNDLGIMKNAAIAYQNGKISFISYMKDMTKKPQEIASSVVDLEGKWITPGFIDCHTHIIFGGNRVREFKMRLSGTSYEEIARQGGGISRTVNATRCTPQIILYNDAKSRLWSLIQDGVTTVEIKSGYGLDVNTERKMLLVAQQLGNTLPVRVCKTFLGAHALPVEYADDREGYIDLICQEMLPRLAREGLIDAVDAFCENIAFSRKEVERVFTTAKALNLPVKLHAEQLSNCDGTELVSTFRGLSADHLEFVDEAGIKAMAKSGTVAVLLPGAFYMLKESKRPPVDLLRKYQVPIAVATDCNPGSSPTLSLRLMANMACQFFDLSPEESLRGVTINAAKALGLDSVIGSLALGKEADLVIWDIDEPEELAYWFGGKPPSAVIKSGVVIGEEVIEGKDDEY